MQKKYQVFVSSTFRDLQDERQDTIKSILDIEHFPSGMEVFHAADVEQFEYIKRVIDECDYYILIIGARYGSTDPSGVSYTEKEYDYAVDNGKVVLAFVHNDLDSVAVSKSDTDPVLREKLESFRLKASTGRLVSFWNTREDLRAKVIVSLTKAITKQPGVGWVRGDVVASEDLLSQINKLRIENDKFRSDIKQYEDAKLEIVADLAGLEDKFRVHYTYNSRAIAHEGSITLTWGEIFTAVGAACTSPHTKNIISSSISRYIKENKSDIMLFTVSSVNVFDTDVNTIAVHLQAIGLMMSFVSTATGGGVNEFLQTTEMGKSALVQLLAVRATERIDGTF